MNNCFNYKGNMYYIGTIVKVREGQKNNFNFLTMLKFVKYNKESDLCYFTSLYDRWNEYIISASELERYIEKITVPCTNNNTKENKQNKIEPVFIEGMFSAWIWYILVMLFGLFLKGPINVIGIWILASVIFVNWRRKKINGE